MKMSLFDQSLIGQYMVEAPGDDIPPDADMNPSTEPTGLPDMPEDTSVDDSPPPDMDGGGDGTEMMDNDAPPDMGDGDDFGEDEFSDEEATDENNDVADMGLDDKVSAIMNMNLYQKFLGLLTEINTKISSIKDNNDILYAISKESVDINKPLRKLDENIRLYLKNYFQNSNYSKNLLFFNKCLNLYNLLVELFNDKIHKGIKDTK